MIVKVGKDEVNLDDSILNFSLENINDFLSKYASLHRYYQNKYNDAAYIVRKHNDQYTVLYNRKFKEYKSTNNLSDKMAEASAKSDDEVVHLLEKLRVAEYVKDEIYGFLKSMDYAHDNAKEFCYNMRKEMDKIGGRHIMSSRDEDRYKMEEKLRNMYKEEKENDAN